MDQEPSLQESPGPWMKFQQWLMPKMTPGHVYLYRRLRGQIVNRATGGAPVLVLTTLGRRSGKRRAVALGHLTDGDDVIVAGTNGGLSPLPAWVLNLQAHPVAQVELGAERYAVEAEFLEGDEWRRHWERLVTAYPVYEMARRYAGRTIPLVRLRRVNSSLDGGIEK